MTPSFNLLDEPWIRVTWLSGESEEVSLLTLFRDATQIEGIHGEIASQNIAILRLLLAICHRTMDGPEDPRSGENTGARQEASDRTHRPTWSGSAVASICAIPSSRSSRLPVSTLLQGRAPA